MAFIEDLGPALPSPSARGAAQGFTVSASSSHVQPRGANSRQARTTHHVSEPSTVRGPAGGHSARSTHSYRTSAYAPRAVSSEHTTTGWSGSSQQPGLFASWSSPMGPRVQPPQPARTIRQAPPPAPRPKVIRQGQDPAPGWGQGLMNTMMGLSLLTPWVQNDVPLRGAGLSMGEPYVSVPHLGPPFRRTHSYSASPGAFGPTPGTFTPTTLYTSAPLYGGSAPARPSSRSWLGRLRAAAGQLHLWLTAAVLITLGLLTYWALPRVPQRR